MHHTECVTSVFYCTFISGWIFITDGLLETFMSDLSGYQGMRIFTVSPDTISLWIRTCLCAVTVLLFCHGLISYRLSCCQSKRTSNLADNLVLVLFRLDKTCVSGRLWDVDVTESFIPCMTPKHPYVAMSVWIMLKCKNILNHQNFINIFLSAKISLSIFTFIEWIILLAECLYAWVPKARILYCEICVIGRSVNTQYHSSTVRYSWGKIFVSYLAHHFYPP